jgi:hypothetical protein
MLKHLVSLATSVSIVFVFICLVLLVFACSTAADFVLSVGRFRRGYSLWSVLAANQLISLAKFLLVGFRNGIRTFFDMAITPLAEGLKLTGPYALAVSVLRDAHYRGGLLSLTSTVILLAVWKHIVVIGVIPALIALGYAWLAKRACLQLHSGRLVHNKEPEKSSIGT